MAGSFFNNPNRAKSNMGRGRQINYDLDDASGWLQQGVSGFKTKAKAGGETIFLPIFPGPIRTMDGEDTDYFRSVQIAEFGLDRNYQSFVANPSDKPDLPFNEIPVVMLHREFDNGVKRNDPAFAAAAKYFIPYGQYKQPDFRWPATWIVFQAAVYRQPALEDAKTRETLKDKIRQLPDGTWVFREPEFKTVWIKGTGRDAISAALHGVDANGNFTMPIEAFAGGAPCAFKTVMTRDKDDKPNMAVEIFDLASNGLRAPTREEVVQKWVNWEKVFRKISYAEQVARLAKYFSNVLVAQVIPDMHNYVVQSGTPMSPAGAQSGGQSGAPAQPQQGQPAAASWGAQPSQPQPAPAAVRTFQQPAPATQSTAAPPPAAGGATWGAPASSPQQPAPAEQSTPQQPAPAAPPPAAGGATWGAPAQTAPAPQQPVTGGAPTTAQPPASQPMTPAEMAARFGGYRQADAAATPPKQ